MMTVEIIKEDQIGETPGWFAFMGRSVGIYLTSNGVEAYVLNYRGTKIETSIQANKEDVKAKIEEAIVNSIYSK